MKVIKYLLLLALIPTNFLYSSHYNYSVHDHLNGLWVTQSESIALQIRSSRSGLKVREVRRFKKKRWRNYLNYGFKSFEDCDGNIITLLGRNRISWQNGRYREVILYKVENRRPFLRNGHRDRNFYDQNFMKNYSGNWYCAERNLHLEIQSFNGGLRARRPNQKWIFYEKIDTDLFIDKRGNRYYMNHQEILWNSNDGRKTLRFSRR